MNTIEELRKLNLPAGQYIVVGGGCLAVRGLRETKDLDIVVLPALFESLHEQGWPLDLVYQQKWNRRRLKQGHVEIYPDMYSEKEDKFYDVGELIEGADIIGGVPFLPLAMLRMFKSDAGREKDLLDVAIIDEFLKSA